MKRIDAIVNDNDRAEVKASGGVGMPSGYRTPDLVNYLNGGGFPTPKSDVYQLGLVLAELFTGLNPQRPALFHDPVVLDPLGRIDSELEQPIADLISKMLEHEPAARDSASRFLPAWHGLFLAAARISREKKELPFP